MSVRLIAGILYTLGPTIRNTFVGLPYGLFLGGIFDVWLVTLWAF